MNLENLMSHCKFQQFLKFYSFNKFRKNTQLLNKKKPCQILTMNELFGIDTL
jgi:hypothetical protein